jgi:5-methylcytosine-specific restriction enzyme A
MLPKVTRESVLDAMRRFDEKRRQGDIPRFRGRHKFAVKHDGQLYPVKETICLAAGVRPNTFSGGAQANRYLQMLGFEIVSLTEK